MERKNYLIEDLTENEEQYIRGIIWNNARKCVRDNYKRNQVERTSIFDEKIDEKLLMIEDDYNFIDRILVSKSVGNNYVLVPYSKKEQGDIVAILEDIAHEAGLDFYIKQLTFKEKLVAFLLYEENYRVGEVAKLLNISRKTVKYRDNCIKEKVKIVKGKIKNG